MVRGPFIFYRIRCRGVYSMDTSYFKRNDRS